MRILLEILIVAAIALGVARGVAPPWRGRIFSALKLWLTVRMVWLLSVWPVRLEDGTTAPIWQVVMDTARAIEPGVFWTFVALAVGVKGIGILCSMYRWLLILRGQGIEFTFRHIFGTFLIGRAIGFFLPSTVGLDAYMVYDASKLSGRTVEVVAGKFLEKVIGFSGIFLSFLVALPFGVAIFGAHGTTVALLTIPIASGVILALMMLLWFPGLVQWGLENVPLPAKQRLHALVTRASKASAAYRDKKGLVVTLFALSFGVHFTTAAMYYFTAIAVGVGERAEFWPIAFGSAIQIFATVIGPTIGGIGIREAAQYALLGNLLGPGAAVLSASLGFLAAEAPTVLGFLIWLLRGDSYRPAVCRVDGRQVDYDEAARAALALGDPLDSRAAHPSGPVEPVSRRLPTALGIGAGAGVVSGLLIGVAEALVIVAGGIGTEAQVLWFGPLAYGLLLGAAGAAGGGLIGVLPLDAREVRGWTASLVMLGGLVPLGLLIALFRVRRDVFHEQMPPLPILLALLGAAAGIAALLFLLGPRLFAGRLGRGVRPLAAALLLAGVVGVGALAARIAVPPASAPPPPESVPAELASRPNLILIMVDTLRADALSCYGGPVETPAICSLDAEATRFDGFSHASWTKPATATLLSSLLPSSHQATSKTATLPESVDLVSELLQRSGYTTGGIVSNINLTESFGFDQGYDEYHYLGPDYLFGAQESSSKLIVYQILRKVWFRLKGGHRVSDFYQDAETVNRVAFDWLERHRAARFFLFLHYMDPHDPYFAHPYDGRAVARVEQEHPAPERADALRALYEGEIAWLDDHVAELLDRLRELGLFEDTVIVLTADHGEEFHDHGGWWHGKTLYEEQIHVPLLVKWARGERPAIPAGAPGRGIDVAPTLLARAGVPPAASMQGSDLAAGGPDESGVVFAEENHEGNVLRALRTREWKWIEANPDNPRGLEPVELYAVGSDRGETRNLVESHPQVARQLRERADDELRYAETVAVGAGETARLTREECERLRVLGYVEDCEELN